MSEAGSDAPVACMPAKTTPTATEKATCQGGLIGDTGGNCLSKCFCDKCPKEAVTCLGNPACKAVIDCAAATGCSSLAECLLPAKCGGVIAEAGLAVADANSFACCGNTCQAVCAATEAGAPDAKSDATTSDAPAAETGSEAASSSDADTDGG
jgi:hypothetical protein